MARYVNIDEPISFVDTHGRKIEASVMHIFEMNDAVYDAIEIVRCKDCKHSVRLVCDLLGNEGIQCRHGNITHRLDWFCADGERGE